MAKRRTPAPGDGKPRSRTPAARSEAVIELSFGWSSSRSFSYAAVLAAKIDGHTCAGSEKDVRHLIRLHFPIADARHWSLFREVVDIVGSWKTTRLLLRGQPLRELYRLDHIAQILRCYDDRRRCDGSDDFCRHRESPSDDPLHFACRFEHGVRLRYERYGRLPDWFDFGAVNAERTTFTVDKPAILRALQSSSDGAWCPACPAYSEERLRRAVAELPSEIQLGAASAYEIRLSEVDPTKILGIRRKDTDPRAGSAGGLAIRLGFGTREEEDQDDEPPRREVPTTRYADVAGLDPVLEKVRDVVELPLTHPDYFKAIGVAPHQGILLFGPPGNGKTLIARAVACESNAHFETISGPEILSKWVGQSEENLRGVFERAEKLAPSVVLIDEVDAIAPTRDAMTQQHDVQLVSQLLVLLEGIRGRGQVAVIGTTNRLEAVDPAIRRPGRIDYEIEVPRPDVDGREAILRVHLAKMRTDERMDLPALARATDGFSGADLAAVCREAGLLAIRRAIEAKQGPDVVVVSEFELVAATRRIAGTRGGATPLHRS